MTHDIPPQQNSAIVRQAEAEQAKLAAQYKENQLRRAREERERREQELAAEAARRASQTGQR